MTTTTRDKMLETTTRLLRVQGFNGTGLNQIIKESGTPKGSLYYHFPGGKDQLAAEAIESAGQAILNRVQQAFDRTPTARQAVEAILVVSAQELESSDFQCGCPIGLVALEVASSGGPVREACHKALMDAQNLLRDNLITSGLTAGHAQGLAELMLTTFEGAMLLCRAHRSTLPMTNLLKTLHYMLPD